MVRQLATGYRRARRARLLHDRTRHAGWERRARDGAAACATLTTGGADCALACWETTRLHVDVQAAALDAREHAPTRRDAIRRSGTGSRRRRARIEEPSLASSAARRPRQGAGVLRLIESQREREREQVRGAAW
jgi:hypothetical protein